MENKETLPLLAVIICLNLHVMLKVSGIHKSQIIQKV